MSTNPVLLIASVTWFLLSLATIALLFSRNQMYKSAADQWERAAFEADERYTKDIGLLQKSREVIAEAYKSKDRECERMRAGKSAINARYEELIMEVTSVGLDRDARHDIALNYITRGNAAELELREEGHQRSGILKSALERTREEEEACSKMIATDRACDCGSGKPRKLIIGCEECVTKVAPKTHEEAVQICDCGSGLPVQGNGYCAHCYIPF